jgi:hypothetical protein
MIGSKSLLQMSFVCVIATVRPCGFAADAPDASTGGACTHEIPQSQASAIDVPNYSVDSDDDPTHGAEVDAAEQLWRAYQASTFDELSASSNPHDWALATLVHVDVAKESDDPYRTALMKRAVLALPDDAMIQWIALEQGQGKKAKVLADAALQALEDLEPDNAAVWNEVLVRAAKNNDTAAQDAALARMATSTRFDTHWADSLRRLLDIRLASKNTPELSAQTVANYSVASTGYAMALPAFQHIVNACRVNPTTGENASRAGDCAAIGRIMATQGDTLIANRIGLAVLRVSRIYTPDDVQRARPDDWIYRQYTSIVKDSSKDSLRDADSYQDDWFESRSEMEAMRRRVLRAGRPLSPPDGWVDDNSQFSDERLRSDEEHFKSQAPAH